MGKGEIARYEQFSFSHSIFKRVVLQTRKIQGLSGKGLFTVAQHGSVQDLRTRGRWFDPPDPGKHRQVHWPP